ncbi:hypothetical protein [Nannocystis pusilla]|uniref:hypothetical protein n=1 Tax=Nannocystis pusilla TaxID=889268 RepID=UPI003B794C15
MRDPLAPIPSPTVSPNFWDTALLPRGTRVGGDEPVEEFSPLRLLQRDQGDTHGLDRRSRRRGSGQAQDAQEHGSARLISSVHTVRRALLGLSTAHGWALVHTLTVAPTGLLVHLLDLLKPGLNPELRDQGRNLLARIAPLLGAPLRPRAIHRPGSPLATIGGCLLAPRVVADLSSWASQPSARRGTTRAGHGAFAVTLLAPAVDPRDGVISIEGELVPMTDPQPQVLAVALSPRALAELGRTLQWSEGGPTRAEVQ